MDALEAIQTRYSCRSYRPEPIASATLMDLVHAGRMAATGRNDQPWEFVVITDPSTLKALARLCDNGPFLARAGGCVAVFCQTLAKYSLEDGCAATQNILIAATAMGLGSCWVAGDKKPYARAVADLLHAPPEMKLISLVAVGFPAEPPADDRQSGKRPVDSVLHWQHF